jgi:hypothetical protein
MIHSFIIEYYYELKCILKNVFAWILLTLHILENDPVRRCLHPCGRIHGTRDLSRR